MSNSNQAGEIVRRLRKEHGYTQAELAERLSLQLGESKIRTHSSIAKIERGGTNRLDVIGGLASIFNKPKIELLQQLSSLTEIDI